MYHDALTFDQVVDVADSTNHRNRNGPKDDHQGDKCRSSNLPPFPLCLLDFEVFLDYFMGSNRDCAGIHVWRMLPSHPPKRNFSSLLGIEFDKHCRKKFTLINADEQLGLSPPLE
jgi:hypothetical protein